jgi:protein gp37
MIFVCSMADLFHEQVPFGFADKVLAAIRQIGQHCYQIVTKRAARMTGILASLRCPKNVWLGVTVETSAEKRRIDYLRRLPASVRFLSCEPF